MVELDAATRTLYAGWLRSFGHVVEEEWQSAWAATRLEHERFDGIIVSDRLVQRDDFLRRASGSAMAVLHSGPTEFGPDIEVFSGHDRDRVRRWAAAIRTREGTSDDLEVDKGPLWGVIPRFGSLFSWPVPKILGQLAQHDFTGSVQVRQRAMEKVVHLARGRPTKVESDLAVDSLVSILLAEGRLSDDALQGARDLQRREQVPLSDALVRCGALTEDDMQAVLRKQMKFRLFGAFRWSEGRYRIRSGDDDSGDSVGLEPFEVLVEGLAQIISSEWIQRALAVDRVLLSTPDLRQHDLQWSKWVDSRRSLREVSEALTFPERVELYSAWQMGWVRLGPRVQVELEPGLRTSLDSRLDGEMQRILKSGGRARRPRTLGFDETEQIQRVLSEIEASLGSLDAYGILGVPPGASPEEVRSGYARANRSLDPGRWLEGRRAPSLSRDAERNHLEAVRAFQILSDPETRSAYDAWRADPEADRTELWRMGRAKAALQAAVEQDDGVSGDRGPPVDAYFPAGVPADPEIEAERAFRRGVTDSEHIEDALRSLQSAAAEDPQSLWILRRRAQLLERAGLVEEARGAYESALAMDPSDKELAQGVERCGGPQRPGLVERLSKAIGAR